MTYRGDTWHLHNLAKWYAHLANQGEGWHKYVEKKLEELEPEWEGLTELARQEWRRLNETKTNSAAADSTA